jgi:hypothetical protein
LRLGTGAELIVGVAGAGKTTLLQVVSAAYEASGCRVIGTATSGQAARTLGKEADLGEARTLASLLWRLDHDRLTIDEHSVIILDEVGMTEDAHLVALAARIEAAGAKLVLVGDHHQLGSVGPGGALAALVRRHPDVVHQLTENRRQHDPAERRTLSDEMAWQSIRIGTSDHHVDAAGAPDCSQPQPAPTAPTYRTRGRPRRAPDGGTTASPSIRRVAAAESNNARSSRAPSPVLPDSRRT